MKFFRKPAAAVLVTIFIVILSTGFSIGIRIGAKCDEVTNLFYTGVRYNGELHPAIGDQLRSMTNIANGLCLIAENYGLDCEDVRDACEWVELALAYSPKEASYINYEYSELLKQMKSLEDKLYHQELSDRHTTMLADYSAQMKECEENIYNAGYNESVRAFLQEYGKFPINNIATMFGAEMPQYFA